MALVKGLHHVTALSSNAQNNLNFYAGILGLRLVKKTINFDAPDVYHLYYGDEKGTPGTLLTFFPFPGLPKGKQGKGQLTVTSFSIPENSLEYWLKRLNKFHVKHEKPVFRFDDEQCITLEDQEGLGLELIANKRDPRKPFTSGNIPEEYAIRGLYGITLCEECQEKTADLLRSSLNHRLLLEKENRVRYSESGRPGDFVDIQCNPEAIQGVGGAGTVHHVAFATHDDTTQLEARELLLQKGLNVTPVIDRQYFHSIYFREPGGVLFEIATLPPGFMIDESIEHLGESLQLPPWEEKNRTELEHNLDPIRLDLSRFAD